jgi:voltage-gated potassium channel Kch
MAVSVGFFVVFGVTRGYRRFGDRFWLALQEHESLRFVTVFISGVAFTLVALFSAELPWKVFFTVLAWPIAIMLWVFPPPCFDHGPGVEPFCEATPIQLLAGGLGLIVLLVFYWCVSSLALRRVLAVRSAGNSALRRT